MRRVFQAAYRLLTDSDHPASFRAATARDLRSKLDLIDDGVPSRRKRQRRHQAHQEWYCAKRYLLALLAAGRLDFPFAIAKGESPDFVMRCGIGEPVGLEVTEATTAAFQRDLSVTERRSGAQPMGPEDGWAGDAVEQELAALILAAVRQKRSKILGVAWRHAGVTDLLLYDNSGLIAPNVSALAARLRGALAVPEPPPVAIETSPRARMGSVSLLTGSTLVHDLWGACEALPVPGMP